MRPQCSRLPPPPVPPCSRISRCHQTPAPQRNSAPTYCSSVVHWSQAAGGQPSNWCQPGAAQPSLLAASNITRPGNNTTRLSTNGRVGSKGAQSKASHSAQHSKLHRAGASNKYSLVCREHLCNIDACRLAVSDMKWSNRIIGHRTK